jgi:hypothetical protein
MAKKSIIRTVQGLKWDPEAHRAKPGEESVKCAVHVEFPDTAAGDITALENEIWNTACGHSALHQTTKLKKPPAGYMGYIHRGGGHKTVLAVTYLNLKARYIKIGASGVVQDGLHDFS